MQTMEGKPNQVLQGQELLDAVMEVPGWGLESGELVRTASFADFTVAMKFVNDVAGIAEEANHHPDIDIRYNKVRLALVTHDAGSTITDRDLELAKKISVVLDGI